MTSTFNTTGTGAGGGTQARTFQPSDIKSLVQKQGRATINDREIVLKSPAATDPKLQEIVKDPALSVRALSSTSTNGESEYELSANGKSVKIRINSKNTH